MLTVVIGGLWVTLEMAILQDKWNGSGCTHRITWVIFLLTLICMTAGAFLCGF